MYVFSVNFDCLVKWFLRRKCFKTYTQFLLFPDNLPFEKNLEFYFDNLYFLPIRIGLMYQVQLNKAQWFWKKKSKMWKVHWRTTDDGRQMIRKAISSILIKCSTIFCHIENQTNLLLISKNMLLTIDSICSATFCIKCFVS